MTNPADTHIARLIETLVVRASKYNCPTHDRQQYITQIAQLRASMEPVTIIQKKKD